MALVVQKYGGTSVGNPDRIKNVARRVLATQQAGNQVVVVVSAMSGVTDNLIKLAREVHDMPNEREMDMLLATGEQTTIALLAMALHALGAKATSLTGAQAGIVTDRVHTKAKIANITPSACMNCSTTATSSSLLVFRVKRPTSRSRHSAAAVATFRRLRLPRR